MRLLNDVIFVFGILVLLALPHVEATKAFLKSPTARAATWKYFGSTWNPSPLENFDYAVTNCGGIEIEPANIQNECGVCGDSLSGSDQRKNEGPDGLYVGRRMPTFIYREGSVINVTVEVMEGVKRGNGGYYQFKVCDMSNKDKETQDCFNENILSIAGNPNLSEIQVFPLENDVNIPLQLPPGLTCDVCTMQWTWITEESDNCDGDNKCGIGYGAQPVFINCADFRIIDKTEAFPADFPWPQYNSEYSSLGITHGDGNGHSSDGSHNDHTRTTSTPKTPTKSTRGPFVPPIIFPPDPDSSSGNPDPDKNIKDPDDHDEQEPKDIPQKTGKLAVPAAIIPAVAPALPALLSGLVSAGAWPIGLLVALGLLNNVGAGALQGPPSAILSGPPVGVQPVVPVPMQQAAQMQQMVPIQQTVPVQQVVPLQQIVAMQQAVPMRQIPMNLLPPPVQFQPRLNVMQPNQIPIPDVGIDVQQGVPVVRGSQTLQATNARYTQGSNSVYSATRGDIRSQDAMTINSLRERNMNIASQSRPSSFQTATLSRNSSGFFELPDNYRMRVEFDREPAVKATRERKNKLRINSNSPYSALCPPEKQICKPRYREEKPTIYGTISILSMICELECADGKMNCPRYLCTCTCSTPGTNPRSSRGFSGNNAGNPPMINIGGAQGRPDTAGTRSGRNNQKVLQGMVSTSNRNIDGSSDGKIKPQTGQPNGNSGISGRVNFRGDGLTI